MQELSVCYSMRPDFPVHYAWLQQNFIVQMARLPHLDRGLFLVCRRVAGAPTVRRRLPANTRKRHYTDSVTGSRLGE